MSLEGHIGQPSEVATKVLRRAEVSKITRTLQNRLALANVKIKHGWENLSLDTIEPQIDQQLRLKRPASSTDTTSDSSSIVSGFHSTNGLSSSPLTAPMFSDDTDRFEGSRSFKRARVGNRATFPASSSQTGRKTRAATRNSLAAQSWKASHRLPESSPVYHSKHARFNSPHVSKLSFISEVSTVPDDTISPELSEDDDIDLPVHSFNINSSQHMRSSPPRTPPPQHKMLGKTANVSWSRTPRTGEDDADLLMYLANSPTPATINGAKTLMQAPSTPPSKTTPLPSSMMSTPGGTGYGLFGLPPNTPSNDFNFADFCNVTPSPAQRAWPKTPGTVKTPNTAREARRKLIFDSLHPPTGSPAMARSFNGQETDLGLDLDQKDIF